MEEVLFKRTEARRSSGRLLSDVIRMSTSNTSSALGASRPQVEVGPGWWAWLERLESELAEQKVHTLPETSTDYVADFS